MLRSRWSVVAALALAVTLAPPAQARTGAAPLTVYKLFLPIVENLSVDHQDEVQVFNRDVFVIVGSTLRNPTAATSPGAALFTNTGSNLGLTWGDWLAASAASQAWVIGSPAGPRTDVQVQLTGLVPAGVYSVFYVTISPDSENSLCPNVERGLPLTAVNPGQQLPDESSFVAGANGQADYHGQVAGNLLAPLQLVIQVIYHFDGQTYDPLPNRGEHLTQGPSCRSSYGEDAMRQLYIIQKFQ